MMCKAKDGLVVYSKRLHLVGRLRKCPDVEDCWIIEAALNQHHGVDTICMHAGSQGGLTEDSVVTGWRPVSELPCLADCYEELGKPFATVFDDGTLPLGRGRFCGVCAEGAHIGEGLVRRKHWHKIRILPWTTDEESWAQTVMRTFSAQTRIGYRHGSSLNPVVEWVMMRVGSVRRYAGDLGGWLAGRTCECTACGEAFAADHVPLVAFCHSYVGEDLFVILRCPKCDGEVRMTVEQDDGCGASTCRGPRLRGFLMPATTNSPEGPPPSSGTPTVRLAEACAAVQAPVRKAGSVVSAADIKAAIERLATPPKLLDKQE